MIDSVSVVAIIAGCSALIISILNHIKTSSCRNGSFEVRTIESHTPTIQTPEQTFNNIIECVSRPPSPAIMKPSEPIPIPKPETPLLLRKNYL